MFKGKFISTMTKEELLDFARWAGKRIGDLEKIEASTQDFRIEQELQANRE